MNSNLIYNVSICTKKEGKYFTNKSTNIHVFPAYLTLKSRLGGVLSLPPESLPVLNISVPCREHHLPLRKSQKLSVSWGAAADCL